MSKKKKVGRPKDPNATDAVLPPIKCWKWQKSRYEKAATKAGKSLSAWIKDLADKASN